ncbi:unnamed protein product [Pseudo-nitzschia multistriata]|uniref:Uncharacterized protein n=1 Tax=Pseudo-nitzschia multistriata TaxID=183589 RepID=A0A448ZMR4_9STRA|nr:unnamed protein product [Pseudo-nitzschia multistriata]
MMLPLLRLVLLAALPRSALGWSHPRSPFRRGAGGSRCRAPVRGGASPSALWGTEGDGGDAAPGTTTKSSSAPIFSEEDVSDFCKGTNEFWKGLVIEPVRNYVEIREGGPDSPTDILSKLVAPPEVPGLSRPVWFTILGSVPTALGWYGYYKFSVEEELFQHELRTSKNGYVTGCGGYGTLFPFVFGVLLGFPMALLHVPGGELLLKAAGAWILTGQVNLYRRVNELCFEDEAVREELLAGLALPGEEAGEPEPPLHPWWALLPPPLDVVVGLRQVHFLSEYWRIVRGDPYDKDIVAEELFPFISSKRFTLKQFARKPSNWFWFTKKTKDFDGIDFLKD